MNNVFVVICYDCLVISFKGGERVGVGRGWEKKIMFTCSYNATRDCKQNNVLDSHHPSLMLFCFNPPPLCFWISTTATRWRHTHHFYKVISSKCSQTNWSSVRVSSLGKHVEEPGGRGVTGGQNSMGDHSRFQQEGSLGNPIINQWESLCLVGSFKRRSRAKKWLEWEVDVKRFLCLLVYKTGSRGWMVRELGIKVCVRSGIFYNFERI